MSAVPPAIADVGATTQRLAQNPRFDPLKAGFGTEEYFVWSRFDGTTSIKDLILMTGLPTERAIAIVQQLWRRGAIVAPGEDPNLALERSAGGSAPPPLGQRPAVRSPVLGRPPTPSPPVVGRTPAPPRPQPPTPSPGAAAPVRSRTVTLDTARGPRVSDVAAIPELVAPSADELAALAEASALSDGDRRRVLAGLRLVSAGDPWVLLGLPRGADKKQLKRAFFERSKLFHPDRYFGKDVGAYGPRLFTLFEALTRAHGELSGDGLARRARAADTEATAPQTPAEYAAELFDRACVAEVSGDATQAMKLFGAAVKLDGQSRYLRRAAVCALGAGELRTAEDYAKKAAALEGSAPSTARILAKVLRALGKLESAEEVLIMALAMKSENDTLMMELASDLRAVRADLSRQGDR